MTTLNFSSLLNLNLKREQIAEMLQVLSGQICMNLYEEIKNSFNEAEKADLEQKMSRITEQTEQVELLEEIYFQKTHQNFLDTANTLAQKYLDLLAEILAQTKQDLAAVEQCDQIKKQELETAMDQKDYLKVKTLLDEILGKNLSL